MNTTPGFRSSVSQSGESELIKKSKQGDRGAFCELVLLHRPNVINIIYRLCGDAELSEDAAQETFIKVYQNLHKFQPRSRFRNWVYRIATNTALDILRRNKVTANIEEYNFASKLDSPDVTVETKERNIKVKDAILSLSPTSRSVIVLREYEGFTYREISETLQIPIGTVMSRLNYARKQLMKQLKPYMEVS